MCLRFTDEFSQCEYPMTALLEAFTDSSTPVSCMPSEWVWCLVQVDMVAVWGALLGNN